MAAANIPLKGNLYLGLGAGGMPTSARTNMRADSGHGAGCDWMLRHGPKPDFALIAKSGWAVSWEEVGLAWYEVRVPGTHTYVGSRHLLPYSNAIVRAGKLIEALEAWFPQWAELHRSGLVAPQGVVSFIQAGWERMPAFTPAVCRFIIDLRVSPRTRIEEADAAILHKLDQLSENLGFPIECHRIQAIAGTTTNPKNFIVETAIEAWEHLEGCPHRPIPGLSGATDANILRAHRIPTARIGLPKVTLPDTDFQRGMNAVKIEDMVKLTRHLIYTSIAVCTR
jgi:succinyl-diaminopimelate desuccinylase